MLDHKKYCYFSSRPRNSREVILFRQGRSLIDDGFDVYNVVCDEQAPEEVNGIKILPTGYKSKNAWQRLFIAPHKLYKKLIEINADVYHSFQIDQLLLCLKLKHKGKKVFFEMREDHPYSLLWKSKAPKWVLKPVVWLMTKWMGFVFRRLDVITGLTYDCVNYIKSWGVSPEKVHLWGNFPEIRKDYSLSLENYLKREDRLLYFGIIYSYSKQEVVLQALKELPNVKYLVAGLFMGNEKNTYKPMIMNMPEWKNVEFVEGFRHVELEGFIQKSTISNVVRDFSVYPMEKSGSFGIIKVFESMEAALPIICSDMPIYRDIMKEYKCGILVDPMNKKQIKEAIEYLVTHKEEAWKMGQEGRRAVIEKYSWDALSVRFLEIVNGLIN